MTCQPCSKVGSSGVPTSHRRRQRIVDAERHRAGRDLTRRMEWALCGFERSEGEISCVLECLRYSGIL